MGKPKGDEFRRSIGRQHQKVGKKENDEVLKQAVAKKQEDLPYAKVLLGLTIFGAVCGLLSAYLQWILLEDEEDLELAELAAAAAAAKEAAERARAAAANIR